MSDVAETVPDATPVAADIADERLILSRARAGPSCCGTA